MDILIILQPLWLPQLMNWLQWFSSDILPIAIGVPFGVSCLIYGFHLGFKFSREFSAMEKEAEIEKIGLGTYRFPEPGKVIRLK